MVNAWSLLYDELYGDEMTKKHESYDDFENPLPDQITLTDQEVDDVYQHHYPSDGDPFQQNFLADNDDQAAHHFGDVDPVYAHHFPGKPEPDLNFNPHKYQEDEGIKDLKDYISSTYSGHYTSDQNNTQTLDLIQSVGDAESFCRSNAIKYLSRYDKKGQAKRDILKALHYSLLLYHFSGQLNETTTRGYETF